MIPTQDLTFFGRRLRILLSGMSVVNYHENYLSGQISFRVLSRVILEDALIKKIAILCEAATVGLTPFGNSIIIVARGVRFPIWQ